MESEATWQLTSPSAYAFTTLIWLWRRNEHIDVNGYDDNDMQENAGPEYDDLAKKSLVWRFGVEWRGDEDD